MNLGKLNQRITIQNFTVSTNTFGEVIRTYTTLAERWAEVILKGGNETTQNDQKVANKTAIFRIRRGDLTASSLKETCRIIWNGSAYDIVSVDEIGINLMDGFDITGVAKDNEG